MKSSFLNQIITTIAFTATIFTITSSAEASTTTSNNKYQCQKIGDTHYVSMRTRRGYRGMFKFDRDVSEEWTKEKRCEAVAERFQKFYDSDLLRYIVTGYVNRTPVLCAVSHHSDLCNDSNVLVTLPPRTESYVAARQFLSTQELLSYKNEFLVSDKKAQSGELEVEYLNPNNGTGYYNLEDIEYILERQK